MKKNMDMFKKLPSVLIHKCIGYTGKLNYRNGKYIDRIDKNDERYELLSLAKKAQIFSTNDMHFACIDLAKYYLRYTITSSDNVKTFYIRNNKTQKNLRYIFDLEHCWRKQVVYFM